MGGEGSTRWIGHRTRRTVEQCRVLEVGQCARDPGESGMLRWRDGFAVRHRVLPDGGAMVAAVQITPGSRPTIIVIPFTITPQHLGGERRWFTCPACGRRAAKLYAPPGQASFACRKCWSLSYDSAQLHRSKIGGLVEGLRSLGVI